MLQSRNRANPLSHMRAISTGLIRWILLQSRNRANPLSHLEVAILQLGIGIGCNPAIGQTLFPTALERIIMYCQVDVAIPQSGKPSFPLDDCMRCQAGHWRCNPAIGQTLFPTTSDTVIYMYYSNCCNPAIGQTLFPTFRSALQLQGQHYVAIPQSGKPSFPPG